MSNTTVFCYGHMSSFWQVALNHKSPFINTSVTPFWRYTFLRLSFGIHLSTEVFQSSVQQIFAIIPCADMNLKKVLNCPCLESLSHVKVKLRFLSPPQAEVPAESGLLCWSSALQRRPQSKWIQDQGNQPDACPRGRRSPEVDNLLVWSPIIGGLCSH